MDSDSSGLFRIPKQSDNKAYNFEVANNNSEIYKELNAINEEIEQWRLENSQG